MLPDWTSAQWTLWIVLMLGAYLLGAIPFGLLISLHRGVDVRQHGSKNIGAANVGRTLGRKFGVLTFTLDMLKGLIPTLGAGFCFGTINRVDTPAALAWAWMLVGLATVVGHMYPVYLKLRGGKGVATGFGVVLGIWPILSIPAILGIGVWALSVKLTRYVGLSSCLAALSIPAWVWPVKRAYDALGLFNAPTGEQVALPLWPYVTVGVVLAALVIWRHRSNLARMIAGTEPRVGEKARVSVARAGVKPGASESAGAVR